MAPIPKLLISLGALLVVAGLIWQFAPKGFPLGKLPGDISIERENFRFYFPLTTSLLISALLSALLYLLRR